MGDNKLQPTVLTCEECGKEIIGMTEKHAKYLLFMHKYTHNKNDKKDK